MSTKEVSHEHSSSKNHPSTIRCIVQVLTNAGLSRAAIFNCVEATLRRLGTAYLDVLFIHRFDPSTPVEETMKALHDLVQSGKVRYLGASSMWATQFARLQTAAEVHGWTRFVVMQNYWNLAYREEEREMVRYCNDTGVGITPWSPLFGGKLARPSGYQESVRSKIASPHGSHVPEGEEQIIARVEEVAEKKGWTMSQVALSWLVGKGAIPITGLNKAERIDEACQLRGKELTDEEVKYLEEPYVPRAVMGHF
jgi:aryl-alcohol dehydrogenase-like predicted oxidoreductase